MADPLLTMEEIASRLGVSRTTLYRTLGRARAMQVCGTAPMVKASKARAPGRKPQPTAVAVGAARVVVPIRPELRALYPRHWRELSRCVRFDRAGGRCQGCGRPHLVRLRCLPDGRWFDEAAKTWRDRRGRPARWPDLVEATRLRSTRVVLAAAHLDSDPTNNRITNLRAFCQRCHMLHDRPHHLAQRWITYRRRYALADLFLGPYENSVPRPAAQAVSTMNLAA